MAVRTVLASDYENTRGLLSQVLTPSYEVLGLHQLFADERQLKATRALLYATQGRLGVYVRNRPVLETVPVPEYEVLDMRQEVINRLMLHLGCASNVSGRIIVKCDPEIVAEPVDNDIRYIPHAQKLQIRMLTEGIVKRL